MQSDTVFNQSKVLMEKSDYWFDLLYGKKYFDNSQELRQKYDYVGCLNKDNLLVFVVNEKSKEDYFFVCAVIINKDSNAINITRTIVSETEFSYFKEFEKLKKKIHTQQQEDNTGVVIADTQSQTVQLDKNQDLLF
jgi:hypothetical protein